MVVDNHPRTSVLLIDMGKPPGGILFQRSAGKGVADPECQEYTYSLTKSKLPPSLPIYKVKAPSHFMWTPTIQNVAEKRMIYENLAYQIKEDAVADIANMIKTNPGGFSYHIFDNKTQRDSFFKDLIIDGFLKRSRFSFSEDMVDDNMFRGNGIAWRHMWMNPFKKAKSWLEDNDYDEEAAKLHLPIYNPPKVKPPRDSLPKVNLTSAFDAVADAKKAEKDLEDAEWISLLSGEPSLKEPPPSSPSKLKKEDATIDLNSVVSTPTITDDDDKEEDDKDLDDKIAEEMVKSLLIERDEDPDTDEEKPMVN